LTKPLDASFYPAAAINFCKQVAPE
jgi:hypothetical protein